jgi:hypothetical protein
MRHDGCGGGAGRVELFTGIEGASSDEAAVELRRRFPSITDTAEAGECARTIASWKPRPLKELPKRPRLRRVV